MEHTFTRRIDLKLILSIIATGLMSFTGVVVETSMNVTFPTLMSEFGVQTATVQWITTGYLLILSLIIPLSSFLKRRYRTKHLFMTAILLFIFGVILDAFASTFSVLLIGRLLQGVGTGIALPLMFNIVLEQVPHEHIGFMMGIATLITATAPAIGPSLGGLIVTQYGWRMIFIILLPVLVLSMLLGAFAIRQVSKIEQARFDIFGYGLVMTAFSSLIFALSLSGEYGFWSLSVIGLIMLFALTLWAFVKRTQKHGIPLVRLSVFNVARYRFSMLILLCLPLICLGLGFLIPNLAQLSMQATAFDAGRLLLPGCILGAVIIPLTGKLYDRYGAKLPLSIGGGAVLLSTLAFSLFAMALTQGQIMIYYTLFALGMSFLMGNVMAAGLSALPSELSTDGNAILTTIQQLAGAIGTAIVAAIVSASQRGHLDQLAEVTQIGTRNAFWVLFICALLILWGVFGVIKLFNQKDQV